MIGAYCRWSTAAIVLSLLIAPLASADAREDGDRGIAMYERGDLIEGMALLESAANAGYAPAQARLGYILDQSEENEAAVAWFRRAAEQDDADGQYGLGSMYAKGDGVEKDFATALTWIRLAAGQGHPLAMRTYATALEKGEMGLSPSESETLHWFLKAAEQGDSVAIQRVADAYRKGELGLAPDSKAAGEWQRRARGGAR